MGADFLAAWFVYRTDREDIVRANADRLVEAAVNWVPGVDNVGGVRLEAIMDEYNEAMGGPATSPEDLAADVRAAVWNFLGHMMTVRDVLYGGDRRDYAVIELRNVVPPTKVIVTGGESWGDSPTDLFDAFAYLDAVGAYEVINPPGA